MAKTPHERLYDALQEYNECVAALYSAECTLSDTAAALAEAEADLKSCRQAAEQATAHLRTMFESVYGHGVTLTGRPVTMADLKGTP